MTRLPIRLRLTLAFAAVMAAVLAAMGAFVYVRVDGALLSSADQGLRTQGTEVAANLARGDGLGERDQGEGTTLAQLLDPAGHVVRTTQTTGLAPLASAAVLARARYGTPSLSSTHLPRRLEEWRVLQLRLRVGGQPRVLVLARSLHSREETLHHLFRGFLVAGPLALLLASLAGYGLAAGALRPVEGMRRRAQAISATTPGRRLPVPRGGDELVRLAETLNAMLARLEASFAHERRFVADASHELRTPLALLRTELELALRHKRSVEELETALRSASAETERLSRLAEDLLLIARADQGMLPIRREPVSTAVLFEHVASRFEREAAGRGRELRIDVDGAPQVDADTLRLEQAVGNLLGNALAHGRGPVTLSARRNGDRVELHVLDEGPGFPEEFLDRAFDRFSRADEARAAGGTGLGLSIVSLIAEAHGGSAGVANRPEGGADVWIAVPEAATLPGA